MIHRHIYTMIHRHTYTNYPAAYPKNTHQCWVQAPTSGQAIILQFVDFDVRIRQFHD